MNAPQQRVQPQFFSKPETDRPQAASERPAPMRSSSAKSARSSVDETGGLITARFKHIVQEGGHAIITGRDGETLQRCEDEPIHIPGAVQGFGLLIALEEQTEGRLIVRVVSENSQSLIDYTPKQLFALDSFTEILSEEQADNLLDHVDFIRNEDADVTANGSEVFIMSVCSPQRKKQKLWCAMHINERHSNLVICEFELEDDSVNPLVPSNETTPEPPEDTLQGKPTDEEMHESTHNSSKPLRVLRSARKRKGEAAAMEVFNIMSQMQEQLSTAPNLEQFLKTLVGVVKELTGFHRVMVYQFDHMWNGRVVTELVDPRATKDLYKGLSFPASDIPSQARDLYKDLETPLDLTYNYLRAMSPIHLKYLSNMAVRSSMSISINAFDELWGLIACHSYGSKGMRVSFPIRKMCRLVGDSASRNIERLSYARYIVASSEDLLKLFDADFGLLSIHNKTKILGNLEQSQEALAMLEYLRMRQVTNVVTSHDIQEDFLDLRYSPGFSVIAGLLLVPLSVGGQDFIVFFRNGQLNEVNWAGNPYEKFIKEGTEGYLEPRKSFKMWSEKVVGKCREWTEEDIETAAVVCLVYGKFIEVWRKKEAALQNSQLTRLLLANSAHEVRTPLNAIINYLEIALEGTWDQETRDNWPHMTKTEEGGDFVKDEVIDLKGMVVEATDMFRGDAWRKNIAYEVALMPGLPAQVIGDQRRHNASLRSRKSVGSMSSAHSNIPCSSAMSKGSEADRQISAISEPYNPHKAQSTSRSGSSNASMTGKQAPTPRPKLDSGYTTLGVDASGSPIKGRPQDVDFALVQKNARATRPGEASVLGQGQPVRPVRMGEESVTSPSGSRRRTATARTATGDPADYNELGSEEDMHTSDHMRVLVAEDDPVNSRIIKKRLEKPGHEVILTVNGEECSSLYGDRTGFFDVVLMDMQMPIVDGLTSTKMIRSFEKSHPTHLLSPRASLNRRVPIIAVSASLIEKERPIYMNTGFDGWILKPISFNRLSVIMMRIVDSKVRRENLYKPGWWENGGWFTEAQKSVFAADTMPSGRPPTSAPGHQADSEGVKIAAMVDDPGVKDEDDNLQSREQKRL
ncbi:hypothetical protein LTR08_004661 [Meristemomyces frigidus]|nr:hypothetical protein LTR08_004661 [Meristemomyces frigidus]